MSDLVPQTAPNDSATLLAVIAQAASDPSADVGKMERLMGMYERMQGKRAESAFNDAMNDAQSKMRAIGTDKTNAQTKSNYATYAKLDRVLRPIYIACGFSLSFDTGEDAPADHVRVLCYVSHIDGHTRTYRIDMPTDGKGARGGEVMTRTHAVGSGSTYGMRYLLKMIFNVAIGEDDDDGNGASILPEKEQCWIDAVREVADYPAYLKLKADMLADYGGDADLIPLQVRAAFNEVAAATKPRD